MSPSESNALIEEAVGEVIADNKSILNESESYKAGKSDFVIPENGVLSLASDSNEFSNSLLLP